MRIVIEKDARKALGRMPLNVRHIVVEKIELLAANPNALRANVEKLKGRPECRLRVGDWRVLFNRRKDELIILSVGPRGSVYGD